MYKVKVNATHVFELSSEDASALDSVETSKDRFHILEDDTSIVAEILASDFNNKTYTISVNNNSYQVDIKNSLDLQIESLGFEIGAAKQVSDIKAPMPGLILEINVDEGQEVKENDMLLILEAMKMENAIKSPRDGIIKSVSVKKGETVDKNSLLIEFQ